MSGLPTAYSWGLSLCPATLVTAPAVISRISSTPTFLQILVSSSPVWPPMSVSWSSDSVSGCHWCHQVLVFSDSDLKTSYTIENWELKMRILLCLNNHCQWFVYAHEVWIELNLDTELTTNITHTAIPSEPAPHDAGSPQIGKTLSMFKNSIFKLLLFLFVCISIS